MSTPISDKMMDVRLIKTQLEQLKERYDAGTLAEPDYDNKRAALERQLLDWVLSDSVTLSSVDAASAPIALEEGPDASVAAGNSQSSASDAGSPKRRRAILAGTVLMLIAVAGGYFWLGKGDKPANAVLTAGNTISAAQSFLGGSSRAGTPHTSKVDDISIMADKLAARLQKQPNDPQGWAILARSYDVLGNLPDALKAYAKAAELLPDDENLKADYARAVAKAASSGGASVANVSKLPSSAAQTLTASAESSVSGTVSLSAALKANVQPDDTLFVLARAQEGSRMPLAILRKQVKDLPLQFMLDDSMGMSSAATLSSAGKVVVVARISKSGNAAPAMGDLVGQSVPVAVGSKDIKIEINTTAKP